MKFYKDKSKFAGENIIPVTYGSVDSLNFQNYNLSRNKYIEVLKNSNAAHFDFKLNIVFKYDWLLEDIKTGALTIYKNVNQIKDISSEDGVRIYYLKKGGAVENGTIIENVTNEISEGQRSIQEQFAIELYNLGKDRRKLLYKNSEAMSNAINIYVGDKIIDSLSTGKYLSTLSEFFFKGIDIEKNELLKEYQAFFKKHGFNKETIFKANFYTYLKYKLGQL